MVHAFLLAANEFCEGYVFTGVCLSTEGVCMVEGGMCGGGVHGGWGVCMAGGRGHAWWWGSCNGRGGMHATHTPQQILRDTVNERAVRILLECILV